MIQEAVQKCLGGSPLGKEEVEAVVREMVEGKATQAQMGGFLVALRQKGETPSELASFAGALRAYGVRISPRVQGRLIDTCGTGGDRVKTFNVSTLSALVAAGAGAKVAKHGNRSVTSRCGSADLLERLGLDLGAPPERVEQSIEKAGVGFLFAPAFHPAMKQVAGVRKELGVRTVFNLLGPLLNPAGAEAQLVGVYSPELVTPVAETLGILGSKEAVVVHALEGMDEVSVSGKTKVAWLRDGAVTTKEMRPEDFGVQGSTAGPAEVGGVDEGARVAVDLLTGRESSPAMTDMVVANSAAALVVAGEAEDFQSGAGLARGSLRDGAALMKLKQMVELSGGDGGKVEELARH